MTSPLPAHDDRAAAIRAAALDVFAEHGFRRTSMAMIAEAVGLSRPALYQYFDNREDVFRAVIADAYDAAADRALAALEEHESLVPALATYLQRAIGDGYHELSTLAHRDEILEASGTVASGEATAGLTRMHDGLRARLTATGADPDLVARAMALLTLAPGGLKSDEPDTATLRRRLDDLAAAVAALIDDELAAEARELGINVSEAAREGLREAVRRRRAERDRDAYRANPESEDTGWEDAEAWGEA